MSRNKIVSFKVKHILLISVCTATVLLLLSCSDDEKISSRFTLGLITNNPNGLKNIEGFKQEMTELGYIEGETVTYLYQHEPVRNENLKKSLEEMVKTKVDLIFTAGTPTGVAAKNATMGTNVPVVFGVVADPVAAGIMDDLSQPRGNMTGVMLSENQGKRLEILKEIVPELGRIFVPYNDLDAAPLGALEEIREYADQTGIEIVEAHARNDDEVTELLRTVPLDVDAIFMLPDSTVNARLPDIVALAEARRIPVSGPSIAQVEGGALTAYGIIHAEVGAQAARIAHQVLKGASPGDLPVETAEFFLGINLQTAQKIGLDIPFVVLQQAEIIIYP